MEELIDVFANNNILILGIVLFIFGLILLGYLLTLILSSKKNKKEVVEEIKEESVEKIEEDTTKEEPAVVEPVSSVIEVEPAVAEPVVEAIEKEYIDAKEQKINSDLEEVLQKMQRTLDEKEEMDNVERFEREQEENAIISYQELLRRAKKDFPQMEINVPVEEPENNEVPVNNVIENAINAIVKPSENTLETEVTTIDTNNNFVEEPVEIENNIQNTVVSPVETIKREPKIVEIKTPFDNPNYEFKNNIFISPIGVTNYDNPNYYKEVKISRDYLKEMADSRFNTVDIETDDIDYETKQNEKFLEDLKSFRSNL
ncbi:MAG: hypothetical protein MR227_04055 [Firmicutes bacterium]|nr:hypothetical protein [Bacillota bacterium]